MLYIYDPAALHTIIVKDQRHWEEEISFPTCADLFILHIRLVLMPLKIEQHDLRPLLAGHTGYARLVIDSVICMADHLSGEAHRKQRKLLGPVFSVDRLRYMLPVFSEVTDQVRRSDSIAYI